jgi:hypothetical protein
MKRVPKAARFLLALLLGAFPTAASATNTVSLIRTPVSIQKSKYFCFQQQGQATSYSIGFMFAAPASGTIQVDGNLMDSFPPAWNREIQASGLFKDGVHTITLTLDKATTLTSASVTAYGAGGDLNLLPVLSCGNTGRGSATDAKASTSGEDDAEIIKKLDDLQKRVSALEMRVFGKAQSTSQTSSFQQAKKNQTVDQRINALEQEMSLTLKNVVEWKKEVDALRKPPK